MRKTPHRHGTKTVRGGLCVAVVLGMLAVLVPAQVAGADDGPHLVFTSSPGHITVPATGPSGAVVNYTPPTANEVHLLPEGPEPDEDVTVSCTPPSGSTFAIGDTPVSCTATDDEDGDAPPITDPSLFTVTVTSDTDLAISPGVNPAAVPAYWPFGAAVNFVVPTATDESGETPSVSCVDPSNVVKHPGDVFPIGQTVLTCTASDADDTPSSVQTTLTVTVTDTAPGAPTIGIALGGKNTVSVSFTPGRNGSSPTQGYDASCGSLNSGLDADATGSGSPILVSKLTNGKTYKCSVFAFNKTGSSPRSGMSNSVVPGGSVEVTCTNESECHATLPAVLPSLPPQTTTAVGRPSDAIGTVQLSTGSGTLSCPDTALTPTGVTTLTDTGFSADTTLVVTVTLRAVANRAAKICLDKLQPFLMESSPTTPAPGPGVPLPCSSVGNEPPCQISSTFTNDRVTVKLLLRGGDPDFRLVLPPGGRLLWPSAFPVGKVGTAYAARVQASGGKAPFHWKIKSGKLPGGLTLNGSTGAITGKPTAKGTFSCLMQATDSDSPPKTASIVVKLTIN